MALYCDRAIFKALAPLKFPATKPEILECAEASDAFEATVVALNSLPDGVTFANLEAVCENVSIVCSLEVYRALEGMTFPATREQLLDYATRAGASPAANAALSELASGYVFHSISDVCRSVLL